MSASAGKIASSVLEAIATIPPALAALKAVDLRRIIVHQPYFYDGLEPFFIAPLVASFGIFVVAARGMLSFVACLSVIILGAILWGAIYFYVPISYKILHFIGVLLNLFAYSGGLSLLAALIWRRFP